MGEGTYGRVHVYECPQAADFGLPTEVAVKSYQLRPRRPPRQRAGPGARRAHTGDGPAPRGHLLRCESQDKG